MDLFTDENTWTCSKCWEPSHKVRLETPDNQDRIKKVDEENPISYEVKELDHVETELKLSKTRKIP